MDTDNTEVLDPLPSNEAAAVPQTSGMPLRRSTTDKMLGGVCGGIARRYGFDPALLRVVTVVAVFAGGLGLLAYAAAWLLLPADTDRTDSTLTPSLGKLIIGVLFGLAAVASFLGWLGSLGGLSGVIVGGFLVGLAGWLYLRRPTRVATGSPQDSLAVPLPGTQPALGTQPEVTVAGFAYGGTGVTTPEPPWDSTTATDRLSYYPPPAPRVPKERSYLGAITLLAAVMVMGLMGAGAAAGLFPLSPTVFFAVPLVVVAAGLLVGAFIGRARWLIIPAMLLALVTAASVPAARFVESMEGDFGGPVWQPTVATDYELGVGSGTLDLTTWAENSGVPQPTETTTVGAAVQVGELVVLVPETWRVAVAADVGTGDISINNQSLTPDRPGTTAVGDGMSFDGVLEPVAGAATAAVSLNLEAGLGTIAIVQLPVKPEPAATPPSAPVTPASSAAPTSPPAPPSPAPPTTTASPATQEDLS